MSTVLRRFSEDDIREVTRRVARFCDEKDGQIMALKEQFDAGQLFPEELLQGAKQNRLELKQGLALFRAFCRQVSLDPWAAQQCLQELERRLRVQGR